MVFETHNEVETWEVAKRFAATLESGDVVCLEGDLGAGKTTFTQGLCAALGARRAVTSPTFCIVSEHPASAFMVVHMDLYRLHDEDDVLQIGWEDYLAQGAVLVVEWPDRAGSLIPENAKHVHFSYGSDGATRTIALP
jgi:tRNA threonylcarbamoyladenosine biosynthesis protein TsaE